jgi:hypothetical protein
MVEAITIVIYGAEVKILPIPITVQIPEVIDKIMDVKNVKNAIFI